jgi:hypothetical protein
MGVSSPGQDIKYRKTVMPEEECSLRGSLARFSLGLAGHEIRNFCSVKNLFL